jgi:hypothetical protein
MISYRPSKGNEFSHISWGISTKNKFSGPSIRDKYSTDHSRAADIFIPHYLQHNTAALIRASLSTSSWNKHLSALNCFRDFENDSNCNYNWPLTENVICDFVSYALLTKQLKNSTVKSYLASLAFYHKLRSWDSSACSSFIANTMLKGAKNIELYSEISKQARKVMTYPLLKILSHQIATSTWSDKDKQVLWTLFSVAFFGSFRFGELIASKVSACNLNEDLLWSDISINQEHVALRIKITKTNPLQGK